MSKMYMRILSFIYFFLFQFSMLSYGSSPVRDTILNRIDRAAEMLNVDADAALELSKKTLKTAINKNEKYGESKAYYVIGQYYYQKSQFDKSVEYFQKSIALAQELDSVKLRAKSMMVLGNSYMKLGRLDIAKSNLEEALLVFKKENEQKLEADAVGNLGNIYVLLGLKEEGLELYKEAYGLYGELGEIEKQHRIEVNISYYHLTNGNGEAALPYLMRSLKYNQENNEAKNLAICFGNLGYAYSLLGNYSKAFENYQHCIDTSQKYDFIQLECDTYKDISETYRKMENYKAAILYQTKYYSLRDSIIDKETQNRVSELQVQFETAEQKREIGQLQQKQKIRNLQILLLAIGIGFLFMIGWIIIKKKDDDLRESQAIIAKNEQIYQLEKELIEKELSQKALEREKIETESKILKQQEAEIRQYAQDLERSNKELEDFAHVVSHDLREPLRMIAFYIERIKRTLDKESSSKTEEYFDFVIDGAKRMDRMIRGILSIAQVQQRELQLKQIQLNEITTIAIQNLRDFIEEKNAIVEISNLPEIFGDSVQVIQLFQNLISNGIKYNTSVQPVISIDSKIIGNQVELRFRDNGIGIEISHQRYIFKMFHRLDNQRFSGTGIGLATCQKIVERHHGTIRVDSKLNEGTTFVVTLPLSQ